MNVQTLNLYLDALLSLTSTDMEEPRMHLIEVARASQSLMDLLPKWLWMNGRGEESALKTLVWMGLSYSQLGDIFGQSVREMNQVIRSQRLESLGVYPPLKDLRTSHEISKDGISCFIVEQQLSSWIDGEWEDLSGLEEMQEHLHKCANCHQRLKQYRGLQTQILNAKRDFAPISKSEWEKTLQTLYQEQRKRRIQWAISLGILILIIGALFWMLFGRSEPMPNIYEIPEQ